MCFQTEDLSDYKLTHPSAFFSLNKAAVSISFFFLSHCFLCFSRTFEQQNK